MDDRRALEVLGLSGPASPADVKAAYRRLARELHPDAGGDVDAFREVQAAYEVVRDGTEQVRGGPAPQTHAASVERRWWESPGAWHEGPAPADLEVGAPLPEARVAPADPAMLATLVLDDRRPARLVSRSPSSRLHRFVGMIDPTLLCTLEVGTAVDGPRPGHDLVLRLRAPGGRGRRVAGERSLPAGWVRSRGSDVVTLERRLRPSREARDSAVRAARAAEELCDALDWPLKQWFLIADDHDGKR